MIYRQTISLMTSGRGLVDITSRVADLVDRSELRTGICHVFVHHTSASLIIQENADPDVCHDLNAFFEKLVPDGDPLFRHRAEGPDDMSAHIRSVFPGTQISIPVDSGRLDLGTWQGLYLWEHRAAPHQRRATVTVIGEG